MLRIGYIYNLAILNFAKIRIALACTRSPCTRSFHTCYSSTIHPSTTQVWVSGKLDQYGLEKYKVSSCVHGHHVFKNIWRPTIGEQLVCKREVCNSQDMAVMHGRRTSRDNRPFFAEKSVQCHCSFSFSPTLHAHVRVVMCAHARIHHALQDGLIYYWRT